MDNKIKEHIAIYKVTCEYVSDKKSEKIESSTISTISIITDYEKSTQPIIMMNCSLDSTLYANMKKRRKLDCIRLKIQIGDKKNKKIIYKTIIDQKFKYYFTDGSPSIGTELKSTEKNLPSSYFKVQIGLINGDMVDKCKDTIHNMICSGSMQNIVMSMLPKLPKMVIENFDNMTPVKNLIIPPISGLTETLKYLNKKSPFYKTKYRFFIEFDKLFLISKKGKPLQIKDGKHQKLNIEIYPTTSEQSIINGYGEDVKNKTYLIPVNIMDVNVELNGTNEKKFNNITSINEDGNINRTEIDLHKSKKTKDISKLHIQRNENGDYIKTVKHDIELRRTIVHIVKANIDISIFNPAKEYMIKFKEKNNKTVNGKYLISSKTDVLMSINGDETFSSSSTMTFYKLS